MAKPTFFCAFTNRIKAQAILYKNMRKNKNKLTVKQSSLLGRIEHRGGGGIRWWLMGLFDLSSDAAGKFSEQWLLEVPASPVPHRDETVRFSSYRIHSFPRKAWFKDPTLVPIEWPYLRVFKDLLLLVTVYVYPNRRPFSACPTESVNDSRTTSEEDTQTLEWK